MRRNLIKAIAVASLVLGGTLIATSDTMAVQMEEGVRIVPNTVDDIVITKIMPYTPRIELIYNMNNPAYSADSGIPFRINIGYGNFSDMDIYNLSDYSSVANQGLPEEVGATKVTSMMIGSVMPNWSNGQTLALYSFMIDSRADLVNGSGGRLMYRIMFSNGTRLLGRVDYTRCINSSVFLSGEATECWMEYGADGKMQYQPYTAEGVRVEIPAEEDVVLTAATDAWEPEYGWPEVEPEPEPEPVEPEPEPVEPEPAPVEPVESEPESESIEPEPVISGEPEIIMTGVKTEGTEVVVEDGKLPKGTEKEVVMTEVTNTTGEAGEGTENTSGEAGGTEVVKSGDSLSYDAADSAGVGVTEKSGIGVEVAESDDASAKEDNITEVAVRAENKQDDVEVPELGQETGKKSNIALAVAAIAGVGVALVTGWWFLFIGKRKTNERKERKE